MQGWLYGNGLIYLAANISANKISLSQGHCYTEGKYKSRIENTVTAPCIFVFIIFVFGP